MEKKFIATTLAGLFVRSDPWAKAHEVWFEQKAEQLNDPSIKDWIKRSDYFQGVDEVKKKTIRFWCLNVSFKNREILSSILVVQKLQHIFTVNKKTFRMSLQTWSM